MRPSFAKVRTEDRIMRKGTSHAIHVLPLRSFLSRH